MLGYVETMSTSVPAGHTWREIWENKGQTRVESYDLEALLRLDGFDVGLGRCSPEQFRTLAGAVTRKLGLHPGMRLLDVGCGAGALLFCLRDLKLQLLGIDYSESLINHARRALPEATFAVADATEVPFSADAVVCNSVFQYFAGYDYAERVCRAFRKAAPIALILDVPDLARSDEAEAARLAAGSSPGQHLYYPRSFFRGADVWTVDLPGYGNAPFRFNVLMR
jgi:SAM-dependent methyltransferase